MATVRTLSSFRLVLALSIALPAAAHAQDAPRERWTLVPELRIGSIDTPNYAFGRIGGLAAAADGSMYVADTQAAHVRMFVSDFVVGRDGTIWLRLEHLGLESIEW